MVENSSRVTNVNDMNNKIVDVLPLEDINYSNLIHLLFLCCFSVGS